MSLAAILHGALAVAFASTLIPVSSVAAELRCPAMLPFAHAGFEQVGATPAVPRPLEGMRLFDGTPGEEAKAAPAELAPDETQTRGRDVTTTWQFAGDEKLLVLCIYGGSQAYYRIAPHPLPSRCVLRRDNFRTDGWCE
jgi:hypothetical protein